MSDESDSEEFYDANELTPMRSPKMSAATRSVQLANLEEEERRLEEQRMQAEERRRLEDEVLQKKFKELQMLKEKQKQKEEALKQAQEHEKRRRKLQEMREHMSDETSPRPTPIPPRLSDSDCESPSISMVTSEPPGGDDAFLPLPTIRVMQPSDRNLADDSTGINFNQVAADKSPVSKSIPELSGSGSGASTSRIGEEEDVGVEEEEDEGGAVGGRGGTIERAGEEPDIIQSVKSSSLGRETVALPVAPPRRKRKNKAENDESADNVPEMETPTSTVYSLTLELERSLDMRRIDAQSCHSLDITAATKGSRLVTATEEASAKAYDSASDNQSHRSSSSLDDDLEHIKVTTLAGGHSGSSVSSSINAAAGGAEAGGGKAGGAAGGTLTGLGTLKTPNPSKPAQHTTMQQIDAEQAKSLPAEEVFSMKLGTQGGEVPVNVIRPRTNSGSRFLTDKEILEQVTVLNLDTGEQVPLSLAEDKIPRCINPLSLHIMRRTKEYSSDSSLHKHQGSDCDDASSTSTGHTTLKTVRPLVKKGRRIKKMLGKTAKKLKMKADGALRKEGAGGSSSEDDEVGEGRRLIKVKASHSHKGPYDFDLLVPVQDISGVHVGAVWTMKFSLCGRLLATGGQDNLLRVWVLKDHFSFFDDMKNRYNEATKQVSPAPSHDSLASDNTETHQSADKAASSSAAGGVEADPEDDWFAPFRKRPLQVYSGHSADLLDVSWSKNFFLLSASMDKTVRLWHVSRSECLCCFQHIDFVTSIAFHPKDDRYFLSGSLDGKLRLWSIPDKKVALWNEVSGHSKLITAANFCLNGDFAVVGTYDGRCIFYSTKQLKYYTQIHVRSTRGKNAHGRKVTGVEPLPGEEKILVTSNDSRIRMYDLRDLTLTCKFKGCANNSSQIRAGFSHDGKYIVCGSEDHFVYIWQTQHEFYKFSSARRDRSDYWEGIKAHNHVVTSAIFAPVPRLIIKPQFEFVDSDDRSTTPDERGEVLVSADYSGAIKVFINKFKPRS